MQTLFPWSRAWVKTSLKHCMSRYKGTWWRCQNTKFWVSPQPEDMANCCIPDSLSFRLWDLLQCFTTHHTVDSHFQGHKKTELLIIHALSHSKQTGKRFHCLSYSDAMSYSLQAYFKLWCVSLFYFRPSGEMYTWYGAELELMLFSGADCLVFVLWWWYL